MKYTPVKLWRRQKFFSSLIGKKGKILHATIIHIPPIGFSEHVPYPVVIVQMDSGGKHIGQLVDYNDNQPIPGQRVIAVFRKVHSLDKEGIIPYCIKFKPL